MKPTLFKPIGLELKDLNDSNGEVTFYYAAWTKDLVGDRIVNTAYDKTLAESKNKFYHNRDHGVAVGKPLSFDKDQKGAYVTSQLALKTIAGNDTYEQYKAGLVTGHSQEYNPVKYEWEDNGSTRVIKEMKLWGVTTVTNIPANLDATTISVKSLEDVTEYMAKINNLLRTGHNISDPLGEKFESEYKALKTFVDKKNAELAAMGVVHCEKCQHILTSSEGNANCPGCGRFVNGKTGKVMDQGAKSFTLPSIDKFKLDF
jgi:HK97 family phage prohead protease